MRKCGILLLLIAFAIMSSSCNYDLYYGERPYDYGNAKWTCETASAWFIVDLNKNDYYYPEGELKLNDQTLPLKVFFINETNFVSLCLTKPRHEPYEDDCHVELDGECVFYSDKLIIQVDKEKDKIFNGEYDELVFVRESIE